jgi:hypothetical protein
MSECRYCGETFEDEDAELVHLEAEHADELGRIDRRRLTDDDEGSGIGTVLAVGVVVLLATVAVGYGAFVADGGGGDGSVDPSGVGSVHYHGTIEVVVEGESVDFSQAEYQYRSTNVDAFHFEGGDGSRWHVHAQRVTLGWALSSLGIEVTAESVTFGGETYRDGEGASVTVAVDGSAVDPSEYVLQADDHIRIVVE